MISFRYISSQRSVVTVAKDGTTRKTVILTTYVEDESPEYETLRDEIRRHLRSDSGVDSIEVHFPEQV